MVRGRQVSTGVWRQQHQVLEASVGVCRQEGLGCVLAGRENGGHWEGRPPTSSHITSRTLRHCRSDMPAKQGDTPAFRSMKVAGLVQASPVQAP